MKSHSNRYDTICLIVRFQNVYWRASCFRWQTNNYLINLSMIILLLSLYIIRKIALDCLRLTNYFTKCILGRNFQGYFYWSLCFPLQWLLCGLIFMWVTARLVCTFTTRRKCGVLVQYVKSPLHNLMLFKISLWLRVQLSFWIFHDLNRFSRPLQNYE